MHVGILIYKILKYMGVALMRLIRITLKKKGIENKLNVFHAMETSWFISSSTKISFLEYKNDAINDEM